MATKSKSRKQRRPAKEPAKAQAERVSTAEANSPVASVESEYADRAGTGLSRGDLGVAAATAAGACALFLTTYSSYVSAGDAPESVTGVKTLGVLHAPGYPSYVLLTRAFGSLIPIGSWAARANLFSLICATLAVGVVVLIARLFGANRWGAAIGAFSIACGASFWFDAGFAKHYSLSVLLIAAAMLCALSWEGARRLWMLGLAGVFIGLCLGAAMELAVITTVGIAVLVALARPRVRTAHVLVALTAMVVVGGAVWVFLVIRASQDPAVNWGNVNSAGRLWRLISHQDFATSSIAGKSLVSTLPDRLVAYPAMVFRDLGLGAVVLALIGIVPVWRDSPRNRQLFLLVVALLNLGAVMVIVGFDNVAGFRTSVSSGGYLLDLLLVLGVLGSLGATWIIEAGAAASDKEYRRTHRGQSSPNASWTRLGIVAAIALVVIVPSIFFHYPFADKRTGPLVDNYAKRVLDTVPKRAVLISLGEEFGAPMIYRQEVDGQRRDVDVLMYSQFNLSWYQEEIADRLGMPHLFDGTDGKSDLDRAKIVIGRLAKERPIYFDTIGREYLHDDLGYRTDGLVSELVPGKGGQKQSTDNMSDALIAAEKSDGISGPRATDFPYRHVYQYYAVAHLNLARAYAKEKNRAAALAEVKRAEHLMPADQRGPFLALEQIIQQRSDWQEQL